MSSLLNQFNTIYKITNNPHDVIPYKYFTFTFTGHTMHTISKLLSELKLNKLQIRYNNENNCYINDVNDGKYLLDKNNPFINTLLEKYDGCDSFKIFSIQGIVEKNTNDKEEIINNNDDITLLKTQYNELKIELDNAMKLINLYSEQLNNIQEWMETTDMDISKMKKQLEYDPSKHTKINKTNKTIDVGNTVSNE